MSIHPQGLSEDPFAPPATLSPEEASHVIQRRVFACGGDGAALFPLATCTEIHRLARGRPDAIWDLAGKAMRAAAAEGAPAVSPAHVQVAAGMSGGHDAGESDAARTPVGTSKSGASPNAHPPARALAIAADSPAGTPGATADLAIDDVPDLPPFIDSGIALPRAPSESLAADTRDWVSRFLPAEGPEPSRQPASWIAHPPTIHHATAVGPPSPLQARGASAPAPAPSSPGPGARSNRSRKRRWSAAEGIAATATAAIAIVCLAAVGLRQLPRVNPHPAGPAPTSIVPASDPVIGPPAAAPDSATVAHPPSSVAPRQGAAPLAATPAPFISPDSSRREATTLRLGLEVATFIFEDRAEAERERLVAAGYQVRVRTESEAGSVIYRILLGPYSSQAAAERAAEGLLSTGTVQQARIVTIPRKK